MPRVEDCGVDIAVRDSVADAEDHELPVAVRVDLLPCGCDQRVEIRLSELAAPRLVAADGAPGLISAIGEIWPRADRQHCAVHRLRNLVAKLPKSEHNRIRFNYWSALTDATSLKDGKLRLQVLVSELEHAGYESAARCLSDDLGALVVHLRYPLRHRERWRSTNLLERSLGEVRRRTKVMGRFPGETSCLSLVWAVLDLFFSHASNGATFTDVDRQHLYRIKYHQADPDTLDEEVTAA